MTFRTRQPCSLLPPHGLKRARPFPCGWRCDRHTPSAVQGKPEPPGPLPRRTAPDTATTKGD
ncbi:hypothetical protein [Streptomyces sp. NBC_00306]|uniref:hypothetical protein n=1 Tax=Streptomyces sp. NBC_00306 TaxID=2975708 RepID=UPI002E27E8A4|nr:hypothetical protein [Streptomyces sp. NBC_00306]